jgi:hypothetical protein
VEGVLKYWVGQWSMNQGKEILHVALAASILLLNFGNFLYLMLFYAWGG